MGRKKLTHKFIEKEFEKVGCQLLSFYTGGRDKLQYRCECGNIAKITWSNFKQGQRCKQCASVKSSDDKRLTREFVGSFFEQQNCQLLSSYTGIHDKLQYRCKCGNVASTSFNNFRRVRRCSICADAENPKRLTQGFVETAFKEGNCLLLDIYTNAHENVWYICECGNLAEISWMSFRLGQRCHQCAVKKSADSRRFTQEFIEQEFKLQKCVLLDVYVNNSSPMWYICECGSLAEICWANFRLGHRCPECANKKRRFSQEFAEQEFMKAGCRLLSPYVNSDTKLDYICKCGRQAKIRFSSFVRGQRCMGCKIDKRKYGGYSTSEEYEFNKMFARRCRGILKRTLDAIALEKDAKTEELIGYTFQDLREHLTNHPIWESVKDSKWHLDHIFPIKAFIDNKIYDIKLINCLENLRPLDAISNYRKNCRYDQEEFLAWLVTKNPAKAV